MSRERRSQSRDAGLGGFLFACLLWLFTEVLHWNGWISMAVSAVCAFTGGVFYLVVRDALPLPLPPELADSYRAYEQAGWRLAKIHPWWRCDDSDSRPHAHLVATDGSRRILTSGPARTTFTDG